MKTINFNLPLSDINNINQIITKKISYHNYKFFNLNNELINIKEIIRIKNNSYLLTPECKSYLYHKKYILWPYNYIILLIHFDVGLIIKYNLLEKYISDIFIKHYNNNQLKFINIEYFTNIVNLTDKNNNFIWSLTKKSFKTYKHQLQDLFNIYKLLYKL